MSLSNLLLFWQKFIEYKPVMSIYSKKMWRTTIKWKVNFIPFSYKKNYEIFTVTKSSLEQLFQAFYIFSLKAIHCSKLSLVLLCDLPLGAVNFRGDHDRDFSMHNNLFITANRELAVVRVDLYAGDKISFMKDWEGEILFENVLNLTHLSQPSPREY